MVADVTTRVHTIRIVVVDDVRRDSYNKKFPISIRYREIEIYIDIA